MEFVRSARRREPTGRERPPDHEGRSTTLDNNSPRFRRWSDTFGCCRPPLRRRHHVLADLEGVEVSPGEDRVPFVGPQLGESLMPVFAAARELDQMVARNDPSEIV